MGQAIQQSAGNCEGDYARQLRVCGMTVIPCVVL